MVAKLLKKAEFTRMPKKAARPEFILRVDWQLGRPSQAWDQLWARILGDVLSSTNLKPANEEECRNRFLDRLEQPEELGDGA